MLRTLHSLSLELAQEALQSVLAEARAHQAQVSIAIVDAAGQPILSAHMDGAPGPCREISLNKARTAVAFGVPTREWEGRLARASAAVREGLPLQPGMALFGGGEPLVHAGQNVGAIGVSGSTEEIDVLCARAGIARIQVLLEL